MFIGHYAVGFAAKKISSGPSLGTYFLAALWLDLIWVIFLIFGWEQARIAPGITEMFPIELFDMPYSHSLLAATCWALLLATLYFLLRRSLKSALAIGICVVSHWFLDVIVHREDMPLTVTGADRLGFGLWNSPFFTFIVEAGLFSAGFILYLRSDDRRPQTKVPIWIFAGSLLLLFSVQFMRLIPPNMLAAAALVSAQCVLIFLGYRIDRHSN
jgi:hypothetical protein